MKHFFSRCKIQIDGIAYVLPGEVPGLLHDGAMMIDIREELETDIKAFGVERVIYLPHHEFEEKWNTLPAEKPLILADSVGIWSPRLSGLLGAKGVGAPDGT